MSLSTSSYIEIPIVLTPAMGSYPNSLGNARNPQEFVHDVQDPSMLVYGCALIRERGSGQSRGSQQSAAPPRHTIVQEKPETRSIIETSAVQCIAKNTHWL